MPTPCEEKDNIRKIKSDIIGQGVKLDVLIESQKEHSRNFHDAMSKIVDILVENTRHTELIAQLKKENDLLFKQDAIARQGVEEIYDKVEAINTYLAKCDGADIFGKAQECYKWMIAEKGIQRFIPSVISIATGLCALYIFFSEKI